MASSPVEVLPRGDQTTLESRQLERAMLQGGDKHIRLQQQLKRNDSLSGLQAPFYMLGVNDS